MSLLERCCYQLTKYPDIFKETHWGRCSAGDAMQASEEIITGRNTFVEFFKIVRLDTSSSVRRLLNESRLELDHPEAYRTSEGRVIIVASLYDGYINNLCLNIGFAPVPAWELYHKNALTFVAAFHDLNEVRKTHREIKKGKYK